MSGLLEYLSRNNMSEFTYEFVELGGGSSQPWLVINVYEPEKVRNERRAKIASFNSMSSFRTLPGDRRIFTFLFSESLIYVAPSNFHRSESMSFVLREMSIGRRTAVARNALVFGNAELAAYRCMLGEAVFAGPNMCSCISEAIYDHVVDKLRDDPVKVVAATGDKYSPIAAAIREFKLDPHAAFGLKKVEIEHEIDLILSEMPDADRRNPDKVYAYLESKFSLDLAYPERLGLGDEFNERLTMQSLVDDYVTTAIFNTKSSAWTPTPEFSYVIRLMNYAYQRFRNGTVSDEGRAGKVFLTTPEPGREQAALRGSRVGTSWDGNTKKGKARHAHAS